MGYLVRRSENNDERLARDAAEFVRLNVDVIVTHGTSGPAAARKATATIPIVIGSAPNLVGEGLVASLARPGGNVTGISDQSDEVINKNIDIITELVPGLQRVAVFSHRGDSIATRVSEALQAAVRRRSMLPTPLTATRPTDVAGLIDTAVREHARGLIIVLDPWTLSNRALIAQIALAKGLPVVAASRLFAEAGALASYGADIPASFKHAAVFVDKILKGAKPADLPVEQPTKFELVINFKTAKALGLTIPPPLLGRADEVIQ